MLHQKLSPLAPVPWHSYEKFQISTEMYLVWRKQGIRAVEDPRQGQAWTVSGPCLYNQYAMTGNVHNHMEGEWSLNDHLIIKEDALGCGKATRDAPSRSISCSFLANIWSNNKLAHLPPGLAPLSWKSWINHWHLCVCWGLGVKSHLQKFQKQFASGAKNSCASGLKKRYFDGRYRNEKPFLVTNEMMSHCGICDVTF